MIQKTDTLIGSDFTGRYTEYASRFLPSASHLHKMLALQVIGQAMDGLAERTNQRFHLFLLFLGDTGTGKSYCVEIARRILFTKSVLNRMISFTLATPYGLINTVKESSAVIFLNGLGFQHDNDSALSSSLFINTWDRQEFKMTRMNRPIKPRFSLTVLETDQRLGELFSRFRELFSRFIIKSSSKIRPDDNIMMMLFRENIDDEFSRTIDYIAEGTKNQNFKINDDLMREITRRVNEIKNSYLLETDQIIVNSHTSRWNEHIRRISMILAMLDDKDIVEPEHINKAFEVMLANEKDVLEVLRSDSSLSKES